MMKDAPYEVTLSEEDMVSGVTTRSGRVDIVWCGFSIHHLKKAQ